MKLSLPIAALFRPGVVLELLVPFEAKPKYKFCAVCGDGDPPLFFLINSEINPYILNREHLLEQQVNVPCSELDNRLFKDSYLDCSKPFDNFSRQQVLDLLAADQSCYMGTLSSNVLSEVARVVTRSPTLRPNEKTVILAAIGSYSAL